jgi:general secretion pathway protein K
VRDRRGFALMAALWLLIAFSAMGLELGLRARAQRLGIANRIEGSRALAAAEGGIGEARARLAGRLTDARDFRTGDAVAILDPWRAPSNLIRDSLPIGGALVRVRLEDVGAALALNSATEAELRGLFAALRLEFGQADRLGQAILDWRDADDLRRGRGAEAADYARQGLAPGPGNRPFARLGELRGVLGMTEGLYARISPFLTLRGLGRVNLNAAPRPVLLALPGMSEEAVRVLLLRRGSSRPVRGLQDLALELSAGARAVLLGNQAALAQRIEFETRHVLVTSEGWLPGSPIRARVQAELVRASDQAIVVWMERTR